MLFSNANVFLLKSDLVMNRVQSQFGNALLNWKERPFCGCEICSQHEPMRLLKITVILKPETVLSLDQ